MILFCSKQGKSNHQLWNELCDMISKNPHKIKTLNVDAIIRGGLRRYTDQVGAYQCSGSKYIEFGSGSRVMNDINFLSLKKLRMKNFLLKIYFFNPLEPKHFFFEF